MDQAAGSPGADEKERQGTGKAAPAVSTWTTAENSRRLEAPLYPQHPDPASVPSPSNWVTPRHLAGDDHLLVDRVGDTLAAAGWRMWPTSHRSLLYVSPNDL